MKKFFVVLSSVALFALWAIPGFTQGPGMWRGGGHHGMGMGGGPGMMLPFMLKKLGLTADQQAQVDKIMADHRANLKSYFSDMETQNEALAEKLFSAKQPLTLDDVKDQTTQISGLREKLMGEGIAVAVDIHNVLTPDQLAKAADLHAKMKALHDQMRGVMEE